MAIEEARDVKDVARGRADVPVFGWVGLWVAAFPVLVLSGYLGDFLPEGARIPLASLRLIGGFLWLAFWPVLWLVWLAREFLPRQGTFPPLLHWVVSQASRGAKPVRLLRHASAFYRRRAANLTRWFKLFFPIFAAVVLGGGITALYVYTLFGPLIGLWRDLGVE